MRILNHFSLWKLALSPSGKSAGPEWPTEGGIGWKTTVLAWPSLRQGWKYHSVSKQWISWISILGKHSTSVAAASKSKNISQGLWLQDGRSTSPQRLMVMAGAPPQPSNSCCADMWSAYVRNPPTSQEKLEICILYKISKLLKVKVTQLCPTLSNLMDL